MPEENARPVVTGPIIGPAAETAAEPEPEAPAVPVFAPEYRKPEAKAGGREFTIKRMEAHVWSVDAPWLEYILAGSNVDDYESLQYFQRQLGESGILDALVQKGVQENDTILIGEYQFDYIF